MDFEMKQSVESLLSLIRLGIGNSSRFPSGKINWTTIRDFAAEHALSAILLDGIEKLPEKLLPPKEYSLSLIGEVLKGYEYRYQQYCHEIAELSHFYNSHGLKMMVLKGYSCAMNWLKPEHRPCGDIDIWLFGDYKRGDELIKREKGIDVDVSHHHHTVFIWREFKVENHYDFINIHRQRSNVELEKILKELGKDDSQYTDVKGERLYIPSPNLHALFLVKHMISHFASEGITLRQVIDWGFFVKKFKDKVDWEWLEDILKKFSMYEMFGIINAISVEDLGFNTYDFPTIKYNPNTKERVLNDIMTPEYSRALPHGYFQRIVYKARRWKSSKWKYKLCYNENMWRIFLNGICLNLFKPKMGVVDSKL